MENSHVPSKSGGMYNKKTREGDFWGVLGGVGFCFSFLVVVVCHSGFFLFLFSVGTCIANRSYP